MSDQKGTLPLILLVAILAIGGFFSVLYFAPFKNQLFTSIFPKQFSFAATDPIFNISDNSSTYPNSQVPKYEKFEVTFDVTTPAKNMFYPYDPSPPPGVPASEGVTVNAEFSQDNFATKSTLPAFYYQDFDYQVKNNKDWLYPKDQYFWKVRFSPPQTGNWQYRLTKIDGSGSFTSPASSFTVTNSSNKGFVKVSPKDKRYFEFDDGSYFPALGYNMNYDGIKWDNPVQANKNNFQIMKNNGIQLARSWLSQWGLFSSNDVTWASIKNGPDDSGVKVPYYGTATAVPSSVRNGSDVAMMLQQYWQPCMNLGAWKQSPAVKPNTKYKVFIRYIIPMNFPPLKDTAKPFGLVAKTGIWSNPSPCEMGAGTNVTPYANQLSTKDAGGNWQWKILEGTIQTSSNAEYLDNFWLVLENMDHITQPTPPSFKMFIDRVEIREDAGNNACAAASGQGGDYDLSNGSCGVDIVSRPYMDFHQYVDQKYSYAFDKVLELAKQNDIYLKLNGLEKTEYIQNHIDYGGKTILDNQPNCLQPDGRTSCPSNNNFYGNWRTMTKDRWLQQAWWRYMQARWGYSTNIHSWELTNEGDPFNGLHWTQADELGKYMHQFGPNSHMVTTSFWNSYPKTMFWENASYPNLDYTDIHQYIFRDIAVNFRTDNSSASLYTPQTEFNDPVAAVDKFSKLVAGNPAAKPIMRGETGFVTDCTDCYQDEIANDTSGKWLHKYVWAGINSGGVIESYWYALEHIYPSGKDFRSEYGNFFKFIKDIPLSNGNYKEAAATSNNSNIRVLGQKDVVNKRAHLFIDNKTDLWRNSLNGTSATNIASATVTIPQMPQGSYPVTWIDTNTGNNINTQTVNVGADGNLNLTVTNLSTDIAVKIGDYSVIASPSPSTQPSLNPSPSATKPGDIDGNNKVDIFDYNILLTNFGKSGSGIQGDIDNSGKVDIFDYNSLLTNFGH